MRKQEATSRLRSCCTAGEAQSTLASAIVFAGEQRPSTDSTFACRWFDGSRVKNGHLVYSAPAPAKKAGGDAGCFEFSDDGCRQRDCGGRGSRARAGSCKSRAGGGWGWEGTNAKILSNQQPSFAAAHQTP